MESWRVVITSICFIIGGGIACDERVGAEEEDVEEDEEEDVVVAIVAEEMQKRLVMVWVEASRKRDV